MISLNNNKWTVVTAGYDSVVLGRSAPTAPVRVNAMAGVSWAQGVLVRNALARLQPKLDNMLRAKKNLGVTQMLFETRWPITDMLRNVYRIRLDWNPLKWSNSIRDQMQRTGCAMQKLFALIQIKKCNGQDRSIGTKLLEHIGVELAPVKQTGRKWENG